MFCVNVIMNYCFNLKYVRTKIKLIIKMVTLQYQNIYYFLIDVTNEYRSFSNYHIPFLYSIVRASWLALQKARKNNQSEVKLRLISALF